MGCERPVGLGGRSLARDAAILAAFFPVFERGGDLAPGTASEDFRTVVDEGRGLFGQVHDRAHGVARGHLRGKQINDWRKSAATLCSAVAASDPEWFCHYWDEVAGRGLKVPKPVLQIIKSSGVDVEIDADDDGNETTEIDEFVLDSSMPEPPVAPKVPKAEVPKAEVPKAEVPKAEVPKAEVPKAEVPKAEVPKAEVPKAEVPKAEVPKAEVPPPVVIPRPEIPVAVDLPKAESLKAEGPKLSAPPTALPAPKTVEPPKAVEPIEPPKAVEPPKAIEPIEPPKPVEPPKAVEPAPMIEEPTAQAPSPVEAPRGLTLIYGTAVGWVETKTLEVVEGTFELDALGVTFTPGLDDSEYGPSVRYPWSSFLGVQVIATGPEDPLLTPHARVLDDIGVGIPEEMIVAFAELEPSDDRLLAIIPSSSSTVRKWLQRLDDAHVKMQTAADPLPDCLHRTTPRLSKRGGPVRQA